MVMMCEQREDVTALLVAPWPVSQTTRSLHVAGVANSYCDALAQ